MEMTTNMSYMTTKIWNYKGKISGYGIECIREQYILYKQSVLIDKRKFTLLKVCTNTYSVRMGLPCCHKIKLYMELSTSLPLNEVSPHYFLPVSSTNENNKEQPIYAPLMPAKNPRVTTSKETARKRGRRIPSRFERVQIEVNLNNQLILDQNK